MATKLPVKKGISAATVRNIPENWSADWFRRWITDYASNMDVRNANEGTGVTITGSITEPATISFQSEITNLPNEPYAIVGAPPDNTLTDYRIVTGEAGVVTITDGGAKEDITIGIEANGIGAAQFRQSVPTSVVGNSTSTTANVNDIQAGADNEVLTRQSGSLLFSPLPLVAIAQIAANTVLGSLTGGAPIALTASQLLSLIGPLRYDICTFYPGVPGNSQLVLRWQSPRSVTIPSGATNSQASAGTAATASATFIIAQNGASVGTVGWSASGTTGSFTVSSQINIVQGDILTITGPATADATLANISITLAGVA